MIGLAILLSLQSVPDTRPTFRMTADELHIACLKVDDDLSLGTCVGYISGALDDTTLRQPALGRTMVCVPKTASNLQLRNAFEAEYSRRPGRGALPATYVASEGLAAAFPCAGQAPTAPASPRAR